MNANEATIQIALRPAGVLHYNDPIYIQATNNFSELFLTQFKSRIDDHKKSIEGKGKVRWISSIELQPSDKFLLLDIHQWINLNKSRFEFVGAAVGYMPNPDIDFLFSSRWLKLIGSGRKPGIATYNEACDICHRLNWESLPSPYPVNGASLKRTLSEIYEEDNGVFILSIRAFDIFSELAHGQFDVADVEVVEALSGLPRFRAIRPKHSLGGVASMQDATPCTKCGVSTKKIIDTTTYPIDDNLISGFGISEWKIARVDQWPSVFPQLVGPSGMPAAVLYAAISGDLFRALHKAKIKGLIKPPHGPYYNVL